MKFPINLMVDSDKNYTLNLHKMKTILFTMPVFKGETFDYRLNLYKNDLYPGHLLFGAPELSDMGYNVIYSSPKGFLEINGRLSKLRFLINYTKEILKNKSVDLIYSSYPEGLDLIIYLRALKLYSKKMIIRQQCTIQRKKGLLNTFKQKMYFKGIDKLLFFDTKSAKDSLASGIISEKQVFVDNWGPDVAQYKRIINNAGVREANRKVTFISTGKDSRDYELMFEAFKDLEVPFELYLVDEKLVEKYSGKSANIHVHYLESGKDSPQIALKATMNADVSLLICKPTRPTNSGFTALCEAMGLGMPVIVTKNPYYSIDVEKERMGFTVPIGDVEALRKAVMTFYNNPEMVTEYGRNARKYAEEKCNSQITANILDNLFQKL
ncbi:Glycosyltransferase involved in cell wall bisynthesis [Bacteroides luti]|uniref:Glycosyltransferase involved in cell wall bisynthesis n=2 Tax=Bacteroides luti TaxID=1297750 RepID=A0A1M4W9Y2_9BACE|nr:Glycosyltransferase involved in cell wall bisynthesis [Bacteroides luti]